MKKIFISFGVLALGLGAFAGLKANKAVKANADGEDAAVVCLLNGAMTSGTYTKKSQIFLTAQAKEDLKAHFHGGPVLERTTYYDENKGALLMGDYDGGFDDINSGYINEGLNAVRHYAYDFTGDPDTDNLFTSREENWKADGQTVGGYYQTLSSLASASAGQAWDSFSVNGYTVYRHRASLPVAADSLFAKFQFFAAPMLLVDNYISFDSVWVIDTGNFLSIRLYADKVNEGISTETAGENEVLISEARVYKGLSFNPGVHWFLKGTHNSWGETNPFEYSCDAYDPEQYKVVLNLADGDQVKVNTGSTWWGYDQLTAQGDFYRWNGGENDNNIMIRYSGEYTFYLKPRSNQIIPIVPSHS